MEKKIQKCMLCLEKCPQAAMAKEIAEGRMYATKEVIRLQKELEEYKQLEEQGLLLRLPCKVGDKVYSYCSCFGILEYEVDNIVMTENEIIYQCSAYSKPIGDYPSECLDEIEPDISDFGKTVFLTREEAEHALKGGLEQKSKPEPAWKQAFMRTFLGERR